MSDKTKEHIEKLAKDSATMLKDLQDLEVLYSEWRRHMCDPTIEPESCQQVMILCGFCMPKFAKLPRHSFAWTDAMIAKEEERLARWRSQKGTVQMLRRALFEGMDTLKVPDDAFSNLSSEF